MTSRIDYNNPAGAGALSLPYHYEMVSDKARVAPFKKAIQSVSKGKIVIESGCGTGIMSILAAKAGAKKVFAVELDPNIAAFAQENIKKNGLTNVKLLQKSTLDVTLDDLEGNRAQVIIAENLSTWQATEPEVQVMNHMNKNLAADKCIRLPAIVRNTFELASTQYKFEDIELRTHFFQFTGIKTPGILSAPAVFSVFDFSGQVAPAYDQTIQVKVQKAGVLNSLRLWSPIELTKTVKFKASDSLMPPIVVPLESDLKVKKGDLVKVSIKYKTNTNWEGFKASVRLAQA